MTYAHAHNDYKHGSARWSEIHDHNRARLYRQTARSAYQGLCPYTKKPLYVDSDASLITIAGAGSGKGRDVLLYTAGYDDNMLLLDPKGELAAITASAHRMRGARVYCVNPSGLHTGFPWNLPMNSVDPLAFLTPDSPTLTTDCCLVAEFLIALTGGKSVFFEQRARQWLATLLKWLVIKMGGVSLPELFALLSMIESEPYRFEEICKNELLNFYSDDVRRVAGEMLYKRDKASGEFSGIMATIYQNLSWIDDPLLSGCLGKPDFSLSELCEPTKTVVFLIVPAEYVGVWSGFLRLLIGVAMVHKQRRAGQRVLFVVDEAAQLGNFEMLKRAYTIGRGFGLRAWSAWQDLGQIEKHYGKEGVSTFLGSSQVRQFFGVRDWETALLVSNMLGNQTFEYDDLAKQAEAKKAKRHVVQSLFGGADPFQVGMDAAHFARESRRKQTIQRPLMTPDEILQMPENKQVLFISGVDCQPIYADKLPYFKAKAMRGLFMKSPYHAA